MVTSRWRKNHSTVRPRSTRTPDVIQRAKELVDEDPQVSCEGLTSQLNIDSASIFRILTEDLGLRFVCSVWVPAILSKKNKTDCV